MAKLSPIVNEIVKISNEPGNCRPWIDGRKKGYRMKFPFEYEGLSKAKIKKIQSLPHVTKVGFNKHDELFGSRWYSAGSGLLCVWVDKRPKEIKIK